MFATPNGYAPPFADEKIHQFSGPNYYNPNTYNGRKTAGFKPGYWDQNVRNPGTFLARDGGVHYADAWIHLNSVKNGGFNIDGETLAQPVYRANIESWNEYDEGSGLYAADPGPPCIAPSNTGGHTDTWSAANNPREYIDTTARYASEFTARPERAACVLGYTIPAVVYAGKLVTAGITVRNEGYAQWTGASGYKLGQQGPVLHWWTFDAGAEGWTLLRNAFSTSGNIAYENGDWNVGYGTGAGGLRTRTGGVDNTTSTSGASTAWSRTFHLNSTRNVSISFKWRLVHPRSFESNEQGEARFELDGQLHGLNGQSYLARFAGGTGVDQDTGWQEYCAVIALAGPADHTIEIGGWNNRKSASDEFVDVYVDDVVLIDVDGGLPFGPGRLMIDDSGDEVPMFGGIFRGRPKTFNMQFTAPTARGTYDLHFQMLQENVVWFGQRLDVQVKVEIQADIDDDGDIDQDDFGRFQVCLTGSGEPQAEGCERWDFNADGDIDAEDLMAFRACMGGAGRPPGC
jgi:hypothetical protein